MCGTRRVHHEIAQASQAIVQFFLGRHKFRCRSLDNDPCGVQSCRGHRPPSASSRWSSCLHPPSHHTLHHEGPGSLLICLKAMSRLSREPFTSSWQPSCSPQSAQSHGFIFDLLHWFPNLPVLFQFLQLGEALSPPTLALSMCFSTTCSCCSCCFYFLSLFSLALITVCYHAGQNECSYK